MALALLLQIMTQLLSSFTSILFISLFVGLSRAALCGELPFTKDDKVKDENACVFMQKVSVYKYAGDGKDPIWNHILIDIARENGNPNHFHRGIVEPLAYYLMLRNDEQIPCKCYLPNKILFSHIRNQCADQPTSCDYRIFAIGSVLSAYCHEIVYDAECDGNVCPFLVRDRVPYSVFNDTLHNVESMNSISPEIKVRLYDQLRLGVTKYLGIEPHERQQEKVKTQLVIYSRQIDGTNGRKWLDAQMFYEHLQAKAPGYQYKYLDSLGNMTMKERALLFMTADVFIGDCLYIYNTCKLYAFTCMLHRRAARCLGA